MSAQNRAQEPGLLDPRRIIADTLDQHAVHVPLVDSEYVRRECLCGDVGEWVEHEDQALADGSLHTAERVLADLGTALDDPAVLAQLLARADGSHRYLSTSCLHGDHGHCRSAVAVHGGAKVAGTCKGCPSRCLCGCHGEAGR